MNCKQSINSMDDAVLETLDAAREAELRRHLAECPACQRRFESERRLLAAIDQALKHSPVSDEADCEARLTAVVRQRIAKEQNARATLGFRLPAAMAVVLAALVLCVLAWRARQTAIRPGPALNPTAFIESAPRSAHGMENTVQSRLEKAAAAPAKRLSRRARRRAPEVLVPKNEMALVLELYNGVRTGKIDGASLLAVPPGFTREKDGTLASAPIEIKPIEIARLNGNPESAKRQND